MRSKILFLRALRGRRHDVKSPGFSFGRHFACRRTPGQGFPQANATIRESQWIEQT